jgi:hypothetical protein
VKAEVDAEVKDGHGFEQDEEQYAQCTIEACRDIVSAISSEAPIVDAPARRNNSR